MAKRIIHLAMLVAILGVALFGMVGSVSADDVYHTERLSLEPVAGAPLQSGFVVNIHVNGPNIYAREKYQLNGAAPNTTYELVLTGYFGATDCSGTPDLVATTAVLTTNINGNALSEHVFTPADAAGLSGTAGVQWKVMNGGTLDYQTRCTLVMLD